MMAGCCPFCLGARLAAYGAQSWSSMDTVFTLTQCEECRTVFTNPLPDDDLLQTLYRTSFDYHWYADHFAAKLRDARLRYAEYRPLLNGSVLDFGGGLGYFSQICRSYGHKSVTYDPYAASTPTNDRWDAVVALHVLEHSNNPDDMVEQIKHMLAKNGTLILAVPNYSGLGYREQGMNWVWAQPPYIHVSHLTAEAVRALLERNGFTDVRISYHDRWDANIYCDVRHAGSSRCFDSAWSRRPLNGFAPYRKMIALFNTYRRFRGLKKSLHEFAGQDSELSEMQITATAS